TNEQFMDLVNQNKVAVIGQSGNLTPADKKIYSLRDVTATVNSIPLIASSIMSKKIAAGSDAIVLDVKTGDGAFMKDVEDAKQVAHAMVNIGSRVNRKTMAVISDMSEALGNAIGNALEVQEAIATLQNKGPEDLTELCLALGSQMVVLAKQAESIDEAKEKLQESLQTGRALAKFKEMLEAQGGDARVIDHPNLFPQATYKIDLLAKQSGTIAHIEADHIGEAAAMLGAGRLTKDSEIDLSVGIVLHKKVGDEVSKGESLLTIYTNKQHIPSIQK